MFTVEQSDVIEKVSHRSRGEGRQTDALPLRLVNERYKMAALRNDISKWLRVLLLDHAYLLQNGV